MDLFAVLFREAHDFMLKGALKADTPRMDHKWLTPMVTIHCNLQIEFKPAPEGDKVAAAKAAKAKKEKPAPKPKPAPKVALSTQSLYFLRS